MKMGENKTKTPFVSAIKVKGIHLLPPVLSPKRLAEMQRYKQQAVKLEKRLQNFRDLKKNLQELLNFQPLSDRPQSEITFRDNSHIEALGITESGSIFPQKIKTPRKIRLSKDIIDVTQYDKDGIKILQNDSKSDYSDLNQGYQLSLNNSNETYESDTSLNKSADIIPLLKPTDQQDDLSNSCVNSEQSRLLNLTEYTHSETDSVSVKKSDDFHLDDLRNLSPEVRPSSERSPRRSPVKSPRPRLIRSNSYTLESPSPILLAHMEKNGKMEQLPSGYQPKQFTFSRNWSSLENNYVPFENSEFSSINTVYNVEDSTDKKNVTHKSTPSGKNSLEKSASPTIEVIQTDISVQQININTNDDTITDEGKFCDIMDPDSQLMQVLRNIPENYSKQIIELIEKQRSVQQKRVKEFDKVKRQFTDSPKRKQDMKEPETHNKDSPTVPNRHASCADFCKSNTSLRNDSQQSSRHPSVSLSDSERLHDHSMSMSPTQSIYYSAGSSDTLRPLNSPSVKLIDLEYDDDKTEDEKFDSPKMLSKDVAEVYIEEQVRSDLSVSRELFPNMDARTLELIKQKWAASVIGAHVKGYLTRRLLKTERVQSLIDTIKDALMCALQLHNADNIDESDVELHRRLINQVSAACYTFHDIFFSLSVQEQMSIISMDRQRKLEKAKRPSSAPALRRSRSTTGRTSSKHKISPQSQSLTKV